MSKIKPGKAILMGLLLLVLVVGGFAARPQKASQTFIVCLEGPPLCQFRSIQNAIDFSPDGATIIVSPGTYKENLLIEKSLTIIGAGPEVTRIEGWYDDLPVIRILGDEQEFQRLAYGEEEGWAHFPTVNLHNLEVVFMTEPEPAPQCLSLAGSVGDHNGEGCSAEVFVRGPVRLILGGSRLLSGTTPPKMPPFGLWAVLAEVTMHSTYVRGNLVNLVFGASRVTLLNNLIEESFAPDPYQSDSIGIALSNTNALLYRNRVIGNLNGIGIGAENGAESILAENEVRDNPGGGIVVGGDRVRVQLLRNVVMGNKAGLGVMPESLPGVVVCEGNRIEGNESCDLWSGWDNEGLAELARRCGVEWNEDLAERARRCRPLHE